MIVNGLWIATSKHSKLHQAYKLSMKQEIRNEFIKEIKIIEHLKSLNANSDNIKEKSALNLIEGNEYHLKNQKTKSFPQNIETLFNKFINNKNMQQFSVYTFKKHLKDYEPVEKERFYILDIQDQNDNKYFVFLYVDSRNIVRKRKFLDPGWSVGKNSSIIDVPHGIPIPEQIISTYSFKDQKLFVHDVYKFERMLYLHEAYKEKAKDQISKFVNGSNKVSVDEYTVNGLDDQEVKEEILSKVKYTKRISDFGMYNNNHPISNIEKAVNTLPTRIDKVVFNHERKEITVRKENVNVFVAIIHNSIVRRLISGETDIV